MKSGISAPCRMWSTGRPGIKKGMKKPASEQRWLSFCCFPHGETPYCAFRQVSSGRLACRAFREASILLKAPAHVGGCCRLYQLYADLLFSDCQIAFVKIKIGFRPAKLDMQPAVRQNGDHRKAFSFSNLINHLPFQRRRFPHIDRCPIANSGLICA